MKLRHWIWVALIAVPCLWVVYAALSPFVLNGQFYHIEQPVQVVGVSEKEVTARVTRTSAFSMPATCSRELVCMQVYNFPDNPCPIEKGTVVFEVSFPLPEAAAGQECVLQGIISYRVAGASLSHEWKSELFTVPERK